VPPSHLLLTSYLKMFAEYFSETWMFVDKNYDVETLLRLSGSCSISTDKRNSARSADPMILL